MSGEILRADDLTLGDFLELLQTIRVPDDGVRPRVWLVTPDGWSMDFWPGWGGNIAWYAAGCKRSQADAADAVRRAAEGRVFHPSGELRWRVIPATNGRTHRVVFLGEVAWLDERWLRDEQAELLELQPRTEVLFLWGEQTRQTPDEWVELRIPHRFRYPLEDERQSPRVNLLADVWRDRRGEPHFLRFRDLQPSD